jgi:hypothetical protein
MVEEGRESAQVVMHEVDKVDKQSVEPDAEEDKILDAVRLVHATAHLLNGEGNEELLQFLTWIGRGKEGRFGGREIKTHFDFVHDVERGGHDRLRGRIGGPSRSRRSRRASCW